MKIEKLKIEEIEQWFELCQENFGGVERKYFADSFFNEMNIYGGYVLVAKEQGKMVGGVRIVYRFMCHKSEQIKIGGLTDLNIKKEGNLLILTRLLQKAMDNLRKEKIDYMIGYTLIDRPKLLKLMNGIVLQRKYKIVHVDGDKEKHIKMRRYKQSDLCVIKEVYHHCIKKQKTFFLRSDLVWEKCISEYLKWSGILEENGKIQGYIVCTGLNKDKQGKLYWNMAECCCVDDFIIYEMIMGMIKLFHLPCNVCVPEDIAIEGEAIEHIDNNIFKLWRLNKDLNRGILDEDFLEAAYWQLDRF